MEAVGGILTTLCVIGTMLSYMLICFEYPEEGDTVGLTILKIWGGIVLLVLSFMFWSFVWCGIFVVGKDG